jgi:hypothetical protein
MLSRQARSHREEPTVRHAAITVQLIQEARAAGVEAGQRPPRSRPDAPPDPAPAPRPRRFATVARRVAASARRGHARTLGLGAEPPGGGA